MDLINRQEAIEALGEEPEVWNSDDEFTNGMRTQWKCDREAIETLSSAGPEIIRCKDCKYADEKPISDGRHWCSLHCSYMYYCSDAERRTDEQTD